MDKINIKETIVVEGRDDTAAVKQAVDGFIIETHGFGIKRQTWELIERAYNNGGIIIFTDPDFSGENSRKNSRVQSRLFLIGNWQPRKATSESRMRGRKT